jgi:hypothetical protein
MARIVAVFTIAFIIIMLLFEKYAAFMPKN